MVITYFQANVTLGTQKRTGAISAKPKFACGGNVTSGTPIVFPLSFNPGQQQTSIAKIENENIKKGDRIDVEIRDVDNGALLGTFTGTVKDPENNNIVDCLIYKGADQ